MEKQIHIQVIENDASGNAPRPQVNSAARCRYVVVEVCVASASRTVAESVARSTPSFSPAMWCSGRATETQHQKNLCGREKLSSGPAGMIFYLFISAFVL